MNALLEQEFDEIPEHREGFQISSIDEANWAFRKLAAIAAKREEIAYLAESERHRINAWERAETDKLQRDEGFFNSLITAYAHQQRNTDPKWKKASTPYGTVKFHAQSPKWTYDEETLLASLKSAGRVDLIRIKEEVNKTEFKKQVEIVNGEAIDPISGEVLDGVNVMLQPDSVVIKVD